MEWYFNNESLRFLLNNSTEEWVRPCNRHPCREGSGTAINTKDNYYSVSLITSKGKGWSTLLNFCFKILQLMNWRTLDWNTKHLFSIEKMSKTRVCWENKGSKWRSHSAIKLYFFKAGDLSSPHLTLIGYSGQLCFRLACFCLVCLFGLACL